MSFHFKLQLIDLLRFVENVPTANWPNTSLSLIGRIYLFIYTWIHIIYIRLATLKRISEHRYNSAQLIISNLMNIDIVVNSAFLSNETCVPSICIQINPSSKTGTLLSLLQKTFSFSIDIAQNIFAQIIFYSQSHNYHFPPIIIKTVRCLINTSFFVMAYICASLY